MWSVIMSIMKIKQAKGMEIEFTDNSEVWINEDCARCGVVLYIPIRSFDRLNETGKYDGFCVDERGNFYHQRCYENVQEDVGLGELVRQS